MKRDLMIGLLIYLVNIWFIFLLRDVLDDFLAGCCRKEKYRKTKREATLQGKIFLRYIKDCIKDDREKESFRKYHMVYLFEMVFVHVKCLCCIAFILSQRYSGGIILIPYACMLFIFACIVEHDRCWPYQFTIHRGKRFRRGGKYTKDDWWR